MEQVMRSPLGRAQSLDGNSLGARLRAGLQRLFRTQIAGDAPLQLEARLNLGPKKSLVLVNCCGKRVLLGVCGDTIVPLADLPKARHAKTVSGKAAVR